MAGEPTLVSDLPEITEGERAGAVLVARTDRGEVKDVPLAGIDAAKTVADSNASFLSTFVDRVRAIVEAVVPSWARAASPPSHGGGTSTIDDGSITEPKYATDSVSQRALGHQSVGAREIQPEAVREAHVAPNAITGTKIPSDTIETRHIAADTVTQGEMAGESVGLPELKPEVSRALVKAGGPASDATRSTVIVEDSQAYTTKDRVVHEATPSQASFETISFDLGYFSDESALMANFYVVGRFYYNFAKHSPRVVRYISGNSGPKHWVDADAADLVANITGDVGHYGGDNEARPHIQAVGNVYFNEVLRTYRRARTFTAGAGPVTQPQRLRLANEDDIVPLAAASERIVLTHNEGYFYGGNSVDIRGTYHLSVQTAAGAFANAVRAEIWMWDAIRVLNDGYDPTELQRTYSYSIGETDARNLFAGQIQGRSILTVGTVLSVRLRIYAAGDVELARYGVDVPIVARSDDVRAVFSPSKSNLYAAVKAIFHPSTNAGVTADDTNNELDVVAGGGGSSGGGGETNLLIDNPASPIAAALSNINKILNRAGRLFRNEPLHYTDPTATYRDFATSDLPAGYTWGGAVQVSPSPGSVPDNRVIYTIPGGEFERKITTGGVAFWAIYDMPNWRGQAANNSDADSKVRAVGDVVFFGGKVQVAATYTARTPDRFQWRPLTALWADSENADPIPPAKLGSGTHDASTVLHGDGAFRTATGDAFALSQVQQIGLLKFTPSPPTVQRVHADEFIGTSFTVLVDSPELLTGDIWYDRRIGGTVLNSGARTKWTNTTGGINFTVPNNPGLRDLMLGAINGSGIELELRFYDAATGGNVLDQIRVMVGGAAALRSAPLRTKALYDGIATKHNDRLYFWPDHDVDAKRVPGGIAVGSDILARNERLTAAQAELLLRRVSTAFYTIPDAGALTWDLDSGYLAQVTLGGAPRNFQPLVNATIGDELILRVVQDATGGRTIAWHGDYKFIGGAVDLSSGANSVTWLRLTVVGANEVLIGYLFPSAGGSSGAPDLRGSFGTAATPVAQDRFFFTDENQSGDPVRYVTFSNLQTALGAGGSGLTQNQVDARVTALVPANSRVADDWSTIPNGTAIAIGKTVEHGGAGFICITAHSKSSTGPDGDPTNWQLLSNWYGDWANQWYPAGALVRHSGKPYIATQAVVRGDVAPNDVTNVKWLLLGEDETASRPLTLAQQTGLTHANINPGLIQYSSVADLAAKLGVTFNVAINDRAEITTAVYLLARVSTQSRVIAQTSRTLLGASVNDVAIDASGVSAGTRNSAAADVITDGDTLHVDLAWYAASTGGSPVSTQRYLIPTIKIPGRFESDVGASGSALPVGTEDILGYLTLTTGARVDRLPFIIPVSALNSVQTDYAIDIKNVGARVESSDNAGLRMTYTAATRVLAYAITPNHGEDLAIGAMRARGFA